MILNKQFYLVTLIVIIGLVVGINYVIDPKIITGGNDMANLIPAAIKINNGHSLAADYFINRYSQDTKNNEQIFSKDYFLNKFIDLYPKPFLYGYAILLYILNDFILVNYLISTACLFVFILGIFYLIRHQFGDERVAFITALLSIAIRPALAISFGIAPGMAIPRNLIVAISPLVLWYFLSNKSLRNKVGLFAILGLFVNVHPLSSIHLFMILIGILWILDDVIPSKKIQQTLMFTTIFLVGALPFIFHGVITTSDSDAAPRELILDRAWFILPPYERNFGNYGLFGLQILPFLLVGLTGYSWAPSHKRNFMKVGIITVAVSLLVVLEYVWPRIVSFEFSRASVWLYPPLIAYSAYAIVKLWEKESVAKISAIALFIIIAFPSLIIQPVMAKATNIYSSQTGYEPWEFDKGDWSDYQKQVLDLANFMKSTPKDSLFLVPPRGLEHLRMYGQRSLVVTHKDANMHNGKLALEWNRTYSLVGDVYKNNYFLDICDNFKIDYIIIDKTENHIFSNPVFSNKRFEVHLPCQK